MAGSTGYYQDAFAAAQRMAAARAAAQARLAAILQKAASDNARLNAAERAYQEGDIRLAARIFVSLAGTRWNNSATNTARQRLNQLGEEAKRELRQVDDQFDAQRGELSPGDASSGVRREELVRSLFEQYDRVIDKWDDVPTVGRDLKSQVAKKRRLPEYAEILNEPEAKTLWELGQQHEQQVHLCCAYWVYKDAAKLAPAPSGRRAQDRLAELELDPQVLAQAKACRELQECHKMFKAASRLVGSNPTRARELFSLVVERSPRDSDLHGTALKNLQELAR